MIKPVSYMKGEVVFKRGEPSRDLFFLLTGEVAVYSSITGSIATRITPEHEVTMSLDSAKPAGRFSLPLKWPKWFAATSASCLDVAKVTVEGPVVAAS